MNDTTSAASVLFITYDGLTDPLGRSQVLPYLAGLSSLGHQITILSCEKPLRFAKDAERIAEICNAAGLRWHPLNYHKRPPILSSLYDIRQLKKTALALEKEHSFDLTHCRSYIPAVAGLHLKRRRKVPFLFDMRGFWPDERVEGNLWPQSNPIFRRVYGHVKQVEAELLTEADHIISLTEAGRRELMERPAVRSGKGEISVIPCCVDLDHFALAAAGVRHSARVRLGIPQDAKVAGYLGSVGTWYLLDEMVAFFEVYLERHPGAFFLLITHDEPEIIYRAAAARGIPRGQLVIRSASREEVPQLMPAADFGLFFIKPVFSKMASSPTKMGELLALGLPVVTNAGVGDVEDIVADTNCGAAIKTFDRSSYEAAIEQIETIPIGAQEIRKGAEQWFDINSGITRYDEAYRAILERST